MAIEKEQSTEQGETKKSDIGERAAVWMMEFQGSWGFLIFQNLGLIVWMAANVIGALNCDKWPFQGLNLFMSAEAANATPIIIMAQRAADRLLRQTLTQIIALEQSILRLIDQVLALEARILVGIAQIVRLLRKVLRGLAHLIAAQRRHEKKLDAILAKLDERP